MTTALLCDEPAKRCTGAADGKRVAAIHLLAIEYADAIAGQPPQDIAERATGKRSYGTGLRKGINLAPYVVVR